MSLTCPFCNAAIEAGSTRCPYCNGAIDPLMRGGDRVADRFAVQDVLVAGPLGVTYRVRDLSSSVDVALLAIADELCPTANDRATFLSRIEMFAGRTIAGCVMPLEVGADDRVAYVTSPIVEGVTLRAVLGARSAARQPLDHEEALRIMLSLAASTSALHSATPHGGLCPETVMVTARGLLLVDCTVALAVPLERFQPRIQRFARAVPFVSPEAARGKRISAVADLYALGAIATELLTGSPSIRALDSAQLPPAIETPLRALLDREAGKRPGALGALLDALARSSGLERRPPEPPLPVPEIPTPAPDTSRQAAADWAAFAVSNAAPPAARNPTREQESTVPNRRNPNATPAAVNPTPIASPAAPSHHEDDTAQIANPDRRRAPAAIAPDDDHPTSLEVARPLALPAAMKPAMSVATPSIPGRLGPSTSPMPAIPRAPSSGPPPGTGERSGPPPSGANRVPSIPAAPASKPPSAANPAASGAASMPRVPGVKLPSIPTAAPAFPGVVQRQSPALPSIPNAAPVRAAPVAMPQAQPQAQPQSVKRAPSRDLDGIDPRLLRAARRLEAERRNDGSDEVDVGEIELVDD